MGKLEVEQIGRTIKKLEGKPQISETTGFADSYRIGMTYYPPEDNHILRLLPDRQEKRAGNVAVVALAKLDEEGRFSGLVRKEEHLGPNVFFSIMRVWVAISTERDVLVDYDMDQLDPSAAYIINVHETYGPYNARTLYSPPRSEWETLVKQTGLPQRIDIQATMYQLVVGRDIQTQQPLTDQSFEAQPLVPKAA